MSWTEERIQELRDLWQAGHSASQIGAMMGVSKNAVVGKAHRLKLPARPSPIRAQGSKPRPAPKPRTPRPVALRRPAPAPEAPPRIAPRPVRAHGGTKECLWPIGDPGDVDFHFCGADPVPGRPYCEAHCAKAYIVKTRERSEAA